MSLKLKDTKTEYDPVVVTGIGIICALGLGIKTFREALKIGYRLFKKIEWSDLANCGILF